MHVDVHNTELKIAISQWQFSSQNWSIKKRAKVVGLYHNTLSLFP